VYDLETAAFVDAYDELPLWSAAFGLLLFGNVPLRAQTTALDVGCGTGFPLLELAQRLGPGSQVHGLDPWQAGVARAERKRRHWKIPNAHLHLGDAAAMPFRDDSFDLIVSNLGVNNFADAPAALRECHRVLREHGTLALTTNVVGHMRELYEVFATVVDDRERLEEHVQHRATVEKLHALLGSAGFAVRRVVESTFTMRYATGSALLSHAFIQFGFLPGWQSVVDDADRERVFAELEHRLNAIAPLTLTIPCAYVEALGVR
jgi:arsenite methyltransferase